MAVLTDPQIVLVVTVDDRALGESFLSEQARFDAFGQLDFLSSVEQRYLTDLLEVVLDRVSGGAGRNNLLFRFVGIIGIREAEGFAVGDQFGLILGGGLRVEL
ncbi:hypothetical protein SDC9_201573 [bioreactor metagenome]|uniref:Uncharacterized protein n=1 Tax=bioreactor metagenome TaxID=1076179 RepID=A0A645J082_9ZZZZ